MNWETLTSVEQLQEVRKLSQEKPVLIFKHSTTCSISRAVLDRLERNWKEENLKPFFIDLHAHRDVSNETAKLFQIQHESPQVLIIKNGVCSYHQSHMGITYNEIISNI